MRALDRKLARDLAEIRTHALAIALVVASGVAVFTATVTAYRSLRLSQAAYYQQNRFADVFARVVRAPIGIAREAAFRSVVGWRSSNGGDTWRPVSAAGFTSQDVSC